MSKVMLARARCPEEAPRAALVIVGISAIVILQNSGMKLPVVIVL